MALSINTNTTSTYGATMLNMLSSQLEQTTQRISTGKQILTAADDPAGMGVLSTLKAQYSSYNAVQKNLSAGQSLLTVASGSLDSQQQILGQMKELATQAASGTLNAAQLTAMGNTFTQLQAQLDKAVNNANLFGQNLTGAAAATVTIQSGINSGDTFTINTAKSDGVTLGVDAGTIDLTSAANASAAMTAIDNAINTVAGNQAVVGAQQNGLKALAASSKNVQDNLSSSIGRIEDADIPAETAKLAQLQAKMQFSTQMLSITNHLPDYALQLLR